MPTQEGCPPRHPVNFHTGEIKLLMKLESESNTRDLFRAADGLTRTFSSGFEYHKMFDVHPKLGVPFQTHHQDGLPS